MINPRDLIRLAVVKTNPVWPFSKINRQPYYYTLRQVAHFCEEYPEIRSVYARHSLAGNDWEPGLSDIDLTVLTEDFSTYEEEFRFLKAFWGALRELQRRLPIPFEINMLPANYLDAWTRFSIRGYEARNWKLLAGKDVERNGYDANTQPVLHDALNFAFINYTYHFLPRFYNRKFQSAIALRELQRIASKILRYGYQYQDMDYSRARESLYAASKNRMLATLLYQLEAALTSPAFEKHPLPHAADREFAILYSDNAPTMSNAVTDRELWNDIKPDLKFVFQGGDSTYIVLRNGLTVDEIEKIVEKISRSAFAEKQQPLIFTSAMLPFIFRVKIPAAYANLRWSREIIWGEDPLENQLSPAAEVVAESYLRKLELALTLPQGEYLFRSRPFAEKHKKHLRKMCQALLLEKLYHEKNILFPYRNLMLESAAIHYPEEFKQLDVLLKRTVIGRVDNENNQEWFNFIKSLADEANARMTQSRKN